MGRAAPSSESLWIGIVTSDIEQRLRDADSHDDDLDAKRWRANVARALFGKESAEVRIGLDRSARVVVQPAAIAGGQRATVTVTVLEPGGATAPAGVAVTLTTTLGALAATQLTTDAGGVARTTLATGGQVGTARLTATVAGGGATTVDVPLRPTYDVSLFANPATIDTAGRSILTLRLLALDPAASVAGVPVQLATTLGRLEAPQLRTDARGAASTLLAADGRSGTATVTATVGGALQVSTTVQIAGGLTLQLSVDPARVAANGAAAVSVLVAAAGGPAPAGTEVVLTTTLGRLDSDRLRTDGAGRAATILRGDGRRGGATVRATIAGTSVRATQTVTFE